MDSPDKRLFLAALERPRAQRATFVATVAAHDLTLRRKVLRLLEALEHGPIPDARILGPRPPSCPQSVVARRRPPGGA